MKYCLVLIIVFGTIAAEAQTITGKAVFRDGQLLERTLEINSVMTMTLQGQTREEPNGMTLVTMLSSKGLSDSTIEIHTTTKKFKHSGEERILIGGSKAEFEAKTVISRSGNIISSTDTNFIKKDLACATGSFIMIKTATTGPGQPYELIAPLPRKPLKAGDEWTDSLNINGYIAIMRYKVTAVSADEAIISMSGDAKGKIPVDNGMNATFTTDAITTGTLRLDPETGLLKSVVENTEMKGIYEAHGLKIPANAKTTVNYTIKPGQP